MDPVPLRDAMGSPLMRRPLPLLAATALIAGACSYDFTNPAEELDAGEVTGRVVADLSGTGTLDAVSGVTAQLKNSYLADTTRDTGRYFLFGLEPGRHTVVFTKGTTWAVQRDVEIGWGSDGQPEGVVFPDIEMKQAVTLSGTVVLESGFTFITYPTVVVVDEETGVPGTVKSVDTVAGSVVYEFKGAPVGRHRIRVAIAADISGCYATVPIPTCETRSSTFVAGPLTIDVPETSAGLSLPLVDLTAVQPSPTPGKLRFAVATLGGSYTGPWDLTVDTTPVPLATPYAPTPDSSGWVELDLPPGLYVVTPRLPVTYSGTLTNPPTANAVVISDQTTELGTFYFEDASIAGLGSEACIVDADCGTTGPCVDGRCSGAMTPQACISGDFSTECANADYLCSMNGISTPCSGGAGLCGRAPDLTWVCIPTGTLHCLWNGVEPVPAFCGIN